MSLRHFPVIPGRWAVTLIFVWCAPMPLLNSLVFLPKFSGPSALLAFSMVLFTVCTHDSFSSRLLMGAHIRKTSLKCQSSDISTGKFRISGISSQDHGCTRRKNRLFSPTLTDGRFSVGAHHVGTGCLAQRLWNTGAYLYFNPPSLRDQKGVTVLWIALNGIGKTGPPT